MRSGPTYYGLASAEPYMSDLTDEQLRKNEEDPQLFRAFLESKSPDFKMQTRHTEFCPIVTWSASMVGERMCFKPDTNLENINPPSIRWMHRFALAVDAESSDFITRDRALDLLAQVEKEIADASEPV